MVEPPWLQEAQAAQGPKGSESGIRHLAAVEALGTVTPELSCHLQAQIVLPPAPSVGTPRYSGCAGAWVPREPAH